MSNFKKVEKFMKAYDQEVLTTPQLPTFELAELRTELIKEEFTELITAINMSKMGKDGKPVKGPSGKVMKGENYKEPNLNKVLFGDNNE